MNVNFLVLPDILQSRNVMLAHNMSKRQCQDYKAELCYLKHHNQVCSVFQCLLCMMDNYAKFWTLKKTWFYGFSAGNLKYNIIKHELYLSGSL